MMKNLLLTCTLLVLSQLHSQSPCNNGSAGGYPCNGIDLQSRLSPTQLGGTSSSEGLDSWGWTDPQTGREYAIVGMNQRTAFVDISNPTSPVLLGTLFSGDSFTYWRDIKVLNNHAYIVSESSNQGMQVFDLTRLRNVTNPPVSFTQDARILDFGDSHNVCINETSENGDYAYVVGSDLYNGGPVFIDISNPTSPVVVGGYGGDGYTHDAQVVTYNGPDVAHQGKEIMIASNEDTVTIIDVTDKQNPIQLSRTGYSGSAYTHQGWLDFNQEYYIFNDELDESGNGHRTRTYVMDVRDLDNPVYIDYFQSSTFAIDHNNYVRGNRIYQANYKSGLRVLDITNVASGNLSQTSFFDTFPSSNNAQFDGAWNVYPYFTSGNMIISDISGGLFIVKPQNFDTTPPVVNCQDITVNLDANGEATITADDIDNGSSDNVLIFAKQIDKTTFTCKDVGTHTVTLTVYDGNENKSTCTATVTVVAPTTRYNGTSWNNGFPNKGSRARFTGSYTTGGNSIDACECVITNSGSIFVEAGDYLNIDGNITVNGTLDVAHEGSIVQKYEDASVTNNGTINVHLTTPVLQPRDFVLLGSPMSNEQRENVYNTADKVFTHNTSNFLPNPDVTSAFPDAVNFIDDNFNDFSQHTGTINLAEGYLVRPRPVTAVGNEAYSVTFGSGNGTNEGTLNNGDYSYTLGFNTLKQNSFNLLANPYPSAISANDFLAANPEINEVYFWEHIQAASPDFPGFLNYSYSMEDVSVYNEMGGTAAASDVTGVTQPNGSISTGQGFAVLAENSGTAVFTNSMRRTDGNNTLRATEIERERIWLKVTNDEFGLNSSMLIGFSEETSNGFDPGYDSKKLASSIALYSHMDDSNEEGYIIQSREQLQEDAKVSLGFSSVVETTTRYTISLQNLEGEILSGSEVYLIDHLEDKVINLTKQDYNFIADNGIYNNRFTLQFENRLAGFNEANTMQVILHPNPASNNLFINTINNEIETIKIFNITGTLLLQEKDIFSASKVVNVSNLTSGIYFLEVNDSRVKKFIIK